MASHRTAGTAVLALAILSLWLLAMLAIPGTTLWFLLLGVVLLRRPRRTVTVNRRKWLSPWGFRGVGTVRPSP